MGEKLIELLLVEFKVQGFLPPYGAICSIAEDLIANGVTIQQWTPVTERLPEDDLPKGSKVKQIKVLTALKSDSGVWTIRSQMRYRDSWSREYRWIWKYSGSDVTHWMPLPAPPKP